MVAFTRWNLSGQLLRNVIPESAEVYKGEQLRRVEALLPEAVDTAKKAGISMSELHELLDIVNEA